MPRLTGQTADRHGNGSSKGSSGRQRSHFSDKILTEALAARPLSDLLNQALQGLSERGLLLLTIVAENPSIDITQLSEQLGLSVAGTQAVRRRVCIKLGLLRPITTFSDWDDDDLRVYLRVQLLNPVHTLEELNKISPQLAREVRYRERVLGVHIISEPPEAPEITSHTYVLSAVQVRLKAAVEREALNHIETWRDIVARFTRAGNHAAAVCITNVFSANPVPFPVLRSQTDIPIPDGYEQRVIRAVQRGVFAPGKLNVLTTQLIELRDLWSSLKNQQSGLRVGLFLDRVSDLDFYVLMGRADPLFPCSLESIAASWDSPQIQSYHIERAESDLIEKLRSVLRNSAVPIRKLIPSETQSSVPIRPVYPFVKTSRSAVPVRKPATKIQDPNYAIFVSLCDHFQRNAGQVFNSVVSCFSPAEQVLILRYGLITENCPPLRHFTGETGLSLPEIAAVRHALIPKLRHFASCEPLCLEFWALCQQKRTFLPAFERSYRFSPKKLTLKKLLLQIGTVELPGSLESVSRDSRTQIGLLRQWLQSDFIPELKNMK